MDLGIRQIRTAGKGSGSVELTLPGTLRGLVGLPCRITLHDGVQPDIVLRPDFSAASAAFAAVWRGLARALIPEFCADAAESFPQDAFSYGLLPLPAGPGGPYLCWQDGLALAMRDSDGAPPARAIAACAAQLAPDLGILPGLADAFGAACGFLAAGRMAFPAWQMPCDVTAAQFARASLWRPGQAWDDSPNIHANPFWMRLGPGLATCAALFAAWSLPGSAYPALCAAWRRGRSIELNRG